MAKDPGTKRVRDLIARLGPVKPLAEAAARLARADKAVKALLPSLMADYCSVRQLTKQELTLEAYTQSVAGILRLQTAGLLGKLRRLEDFRNVERITVRVANLPQAAVTPATPAKPNPISPENLELLRETANSVASRELAGALQQLARTLERHKSKKPPGSAGAS
jgi:hypothetical protein